MPRDVKSQSTLRLLALAGLLLASPFAVRGGKVVGNDACGQNTGTCCPQFIAICVIGPFVHDGYFYQASGPC